MPEGDTPKTVEQSTAEPFPEYLKWGLTFDKLRKLITITAFSLPTPEHINPMMQSPEKLSYLDILLDSLGVTGLGEHSKDRFGGNFNSDYETSREKQLKDRFEVYDGGDILAVLKTEEFGENVALIAIDPRSWPPSTQFYQLVAVSEPVQMRTDEEYHVAKAIYEKLMGPIDTATLFRQFEKSRRGTIRFRSTQELDSHYLKNCLDDLVNDLRDVVTAHSGYTHYQEQQDATLRARVNEVMSEIFEH